MPASPIWSVLFFCMLLTLGLGSMFGTLEGVITPFYDMKIVPFRKEIMTGMYLPEIFYKPIYSALLTDVNPPKPTVQG